MFNNTGTREVLFAFTAIGAAQPRTRLFSLALTEKCAPRGLFIKQKFMRGDENYVLLSEVSVSAVSSDVLVIRLGKDLENVSSGTENFTWMLGVARIGRSRPQRGPLPGLTTCPPGS